ncbi:GNAT family N-acetyltransferase [Streptomyces sp. L7]
MELSVHPAERRQGIGTRLLEAAAAAARAEGRRSIVTQAQRVPRRRVPAGQRLPSGADPDVRPAVAVRRGSHGDRQACPTPAPRLRVDAEWRGTVPGQTRPLLRRVAQRDGRHADAGHRLRHRRMGCGTTGRGGRGGRATRGAPAHRRRRGHDRRTRRRLLRTGRAGRRARRRTALRYGRTARPSWPLVSPAG